jgi:CBS domain-containing protein
MGRAGTRRLVVTGEDNRVVGLLSLDDVLGVLVDETKAVGRLLEQQMPRIPA